MHHRPAQNTWNTKKGATACSPKSCPNVGTGMSNTFLPYDVNASSTSRGVDNPCACWNVDRTGRGLESHGYEMRLNVSVDSEKTYLSRWYEK